MKISQSRLKQIIKEEIEKQLKKDSLDESLKSKLLGMAAGALAMFPAIGSATPKVVTFDTPQGQFSIVRDDKGMEQEKFAKSVEKAIKSTPQTKSWNIVSIKDAPEKPIATAFDLKTKMLSFKSTSDMIKYIKSMGISTAQSEQSIASQLMEKTGVKHSASDVLDLADAMLEVQKNSK